MDVIVDNCTICHQTTHILSHDQKTRNFVGIIQQIVPKKSLNITEFDKISLKLCLICCKKLSIANTQNELIQSGETVEKLKASTGDRCQLCCNDQNLIKLENNWKLQWSFDSTIDKNKLLCLDCFYYFDIVTFVKNGLFKSFPKLDVNHKKKHKVNKLLLNLEPVSKTVYKIPEDVCNDLKLYKKLPYIDLTVNNNNHHYRNRSIVRHKSIKIKSTNTKLSTPKFKIKLKKSMKKTRKERKSRIVKMENGKTVIGHPQNTSTPMKIDSEIKNLDDETPKLNISNNLSRRLSVIFDNTTNEEN